MTKRERQLTEAIAGMMLTMHPDNGLAPYLGGYIILEDVAERAKAATVTVDRDGFGVVRVSVKMDAR